MTKSDIYYFPQPCAKRCVRDRIFQGMSLYYYLVIYYLLIIGGIEINPGPTLNSNIKIIHNNVCSILPKIDIIYNEFYEYDIVAITESHLDQSITDNDIELEGFQAPVRLDRNRYGGGVMIYVKSNLSFKKREDIFTSNIEIIWIEIENGNHKFLVGVIYRPPSAKADFVNQLALSIESALNAELPIFLLGDFNFDMLADGNNAFKNMLQNFSLSNVVTKPTNFSRSKGTCIDLIITNAVEKIETVNILTPFCSTHSPVGVDLHFKTFKQHSYKRYIRNYTKANYSQLCTDLSNVDWDREVFNTHNINDINDNFMKIYNHYVDKNIPKKVVTIRPSDKPFMTSAIRCKMRQRNRVHFKAKANNNEYQ